MTSEKGMRGWPKYLADATLTGGNFNTDYPISNLQDEVEMARVARTTSTADGAFQVKMVFSSLVALRILALIRHNFSTQATWRRRVYSDATFTTLIYDSGFTPVFLPQDFDLEFEDDGWWTRTFDEDDLSDTQWPLIDVFEERYYALSAIIDVSDVDNADGYLQAGLAYASKDLQPSINHGYGFRQGFEPRSREIEAEGGSSYTERLEKRRIYEGTIAHLPMNELRAGLRELQRLADTTEPFLFIPNPADATTWPYEAALVRNQTLDPITQAAAQRGTIAFSYKEHL